MWPWIIGGGVVSLYLIGKSGEAKAAPGAPTPTPTPRSIFGSIKAGFEKMTGGFGAIPTCSDPQVTAIIQKFYAGNASTNDIRVAMQRAQLSGCTATAEHLLKIARSRGHDVSATDLELE